MGEYELAESQRKLFEERSAIAAEASAVAAEVSAVAAEASAVAADAEVAESSAVRRRGKRVRRVRPSTTAEAVTPQCDTSQEHDAECAETQPDKSEDEAELDRSRGFLPGQREIVFIKCADCPFAETCGKAKRKGEDVYTFCEYYCPRCGAWVKIQARIEIG